MNKKNDAPRGILKVRDGRATLDTKELNDITDFLFQLERTRAPGTRRNWADLRENVKRRVEAHTKDRLDEKLLDDWITKRIAETAAPFPLRTTNPTRLDEVQRYLISIPDKTRRVAECDRLCAPLGREFDISRRSWLADMPESTFKRWRRKAREK